MKILVVCLLLLACLPLSLPAGAGLIHPELGVECWRRHPAPGEAGSPDCRRRSASPRGDYIGTIILDRDGAKGCPIFPSWGDRRPDNVDWDRQCNARYVECQGQCSHR